MNKTENTMKMEFDMFVNFPFLSDPKNLSNLQKFSTELQKRGLGSFENGTLTFDSQDVEEVEKLSDSIFISDFKFRVK